MSIDRPAASPALEDVLDVLGRGTLEIEGRLVDASNATLVAVASLDGVAMRCVYKPVAGERPLWDFPDATLGHREVAAYEVSAASGWELVPPTAWREDGPFGAGMCQLWVETAADAAAFGDADDEPLEPVEPDGLADDDLVDIVAREDVPPGWRAVLRAHGADGEPVVLTHAPHPALMRMALLDAVINNADRKGGHILVRPDGQVRGVDHGVCFNLDEKLRTVLWGWSGEDIPASRLDELGALRATFEGSLGHVLSMHLTRAEIASTRRRLDDLLGTARFPLPADGWPSIPWPAF